MLELEGVERSIVYCSLVGSHNYNLNELNSDKDYKVFVVPSFDDLYYNQQYSKASIGEDIDYEVHDIRKLASLLWKGNIHFIETLFSEEYYLGPELWAKRMGDILNQKDRLARMNLSYLWDACQGKFFNKFKALEKATAGTKDLFKKYGYDTKQAQHCYRCLDFLERYQKRDFNDFKGAIYYDEGAERDFIINIKQGVFSLDEFKKMVQAKQNEISRLERLYKIQSADNVLHEVLDKQVKKLIRESMISSTVN